MRIWQKKMEGGDVSRSPRVSTWRNLFFGGWRRSVLGNRWTATKGAEGGRWKEAAGWKIIRFPLTGGVATASLVGIFRAFLIPSNRPKLAKQPSKGELERGDKVYEENKQRGFNWGN
jgi:hypothetical protein